MEISKAKEQEVKRNILQEHEESYLKGYESRLNALIKISKENGLSPINWWTIFSCFTFITLFSLFHCLNQIDFDFRYRLPCLLPLVLLATLGLSELLEAVSLKRKKSTG